MNKLIILIVFLFVGCGYDIPMIGDKEQPFVVNEIYEVSPTHSIYRSGNRLSDRGAGLFVLDRSKVCLKTGLYNIGDTIQINR